MLTWPKKHNIEIKKQTLHQNKRPILIKSKKYRYYRY